MARKIKNLYLALERVARVLLPFVSPPSLLRERERGCPEPRASLCLTLLLYFRLIRLFSLLLFLSYSHSRVFSLSLSLDVYFRLAHALVSLVPLSTCVSFLSRTLIRSLT